MLTQPKLKFQQDHADSLANSLPVLKNTHHYLRDIKINNIVTCITHPAYNKKLRHIERSKKNVTCDL